VSRKSDSNPAGATKTVVLDYYIVEHSFVARVYRRQGRVERLLPEDGRWVPYNDAWDVYTNGRQVSEQEAMERARYFADEKKKEVILEERRKRRAQRQK
jgi:hypothetical protein